MAVHAGGPSRLPGRTASTRRWTRSTNCQPRDEALKHSRLLLAGAGYHSAKLEGAYRAGASGRLPLAAGKGGMAVHLHNLLLDGLFFPGKQCSVAGPALTAGLAGACQAAAQALAAGGGPLDAVGAALVVLEVGVKRLAGCAERTFSARQVERARQPRLVHTPPQHATLGAAADMRERACVPAGRTPKGAQLLITFCPTVSYVQSTSSTRTLVDAGLRGVQRRARLQPDVWRCCGVRCERDGRGWQL